MHAREGCKKDGRHFTISWPWFYCKMHHFILKKLGKLYKSLYRSGFNFKIKPYVGTGAELEIFVWGLFLSYFNSTISFFFWD
jgi:hypothetical protein